MEQNQSAKKNAASMMKPEYAGTNPQEVKQQIKKDVSEGEGSMTSRQAGHMRD